jgi:ABC-2 type transport system ATP-binding protein
MAAPAILTDHFTREFPSVRAVDDLLLEVPSGIVFGLLGPNGSGKTTIIRLLLGLLEPTSGRAEILGLDTRTQAGEIRARCGALLEHPGLYERLSAQENLDYFGRIWRLPAAERQIRIQDLLEHVGLWERRKDRTGTWSQGMKQKLAVARALLHRLSLVFLDEPTAGLDPVAAAALREDLSSLAAREGVTVFLTTHNLAEAERLCARVAVIRRGRLLAGGSPDQLRVRTGTTRVEIHGHGSGEALLARLRTLPEVKTVTVADGRMTLDLVEAVDVAPLVSLLVHEGAAIEEVRRDQGSLEEAFLALVKEEEDAH